MIDFSTLYKKYSKDVYRFALYLSGEHGQAEDITSETFVRAWASPEPIEAATVKSYLFTIARNLFLQGVRKRSRQVELQRDFQDGGAGPHARAEQREKLDAVMAELQKLPELSRAALLMHAVDEMPYEEIARVLDISLAAVKGKIFRARLAVAGLKDV